ncbi:hypothetical protein [Thalassobaculum sp.]|uniref:hypothetical protein n=1 Tax=Thalassobaculum sp. TaxID=2022740 RepID=UPI0032ED3301
MHYIDGMASLNSPLSVRLSEQDTNFLAEIEIEGAVTASDKIRGLIRLAREHGGRPETFADALAISQERIGDTIRTLRVIEQETGEHSAVTVGLLGVAEELLALAMLAPEPGTGDTPAELVRYEAQLVGCAARMVEQLLRWGVTPTAPAYNPTVVRRHVADLVDLMRLISDASASR